MPSTFVFVWILLLVLIAVAIFAGVKTVPQGQVWTVERFGAYTRELHPGLSILIPFIPPVGAKLKVVDVEGTVLVVQPTANG